MSMSHEGAALHGVSQGFAVADPVSYPLADTCLCESPQGGEA